MTRTPILGLLALALTIGLSFTSISNKAVAAGKLVVFNVGNGAEPKTIDPHKIEGVPEHHITENLFEPLVSQHPTTLKPVPGGAESWQISKDKKVYTFKLRKNQKWSNGEPVTAKDYVYGWTRLLEPKTAADYAYYGYYFKNGRAYNKGELKDASQLGFKAIDDYTVQVTLEQPTAYFLGLLYHQALHPVHRATIEKFGDRWVRPENMVSNGPFMLDKWETNKVLTVKKNPYYWDKDTVKLDVVNFYPIDNLDTEEKMFRTGQLHKTNEIPLEKIPFWQKDKTGVFHSVPLSGTYYYDFNVNRAPLKDKRIRKALTLAVDRGKLVKFVTKGNQLPASTFVPPGTGPDGYKSPKSWIPTDSSGFPEAKKLLAEAGFPGGKGFPALEILYNTHEGHKKLAEAIQQMWKENLGIEAKLVNQEWKVFIDSRTKHDFQVARDGWFTDYADPNGFLDILTSGVMTNNPGWSNKEYDALLKQGGIEQNPKKRNAILAQAEALILEEVPVMPLYVYTRNFLLDKKVQNWPINLQENEMLKYVSLKE